MKIVICFNFCILGGEITAQLPHTVIGALASRMIETGCPTVFISNIQEKKEDGMMSTAWLGCMHFAKKYKKQGL